MDSMPSDAQAKAAEPARKQDGWRETLRFLLILFVFTILLRSLIVAPFSIPSGSMLPRMMIGDYLFVAKWPYGYSRFSMPFGLGSFEGRVLGSEPQRGDVVVFKDPGGWLSEADSAAPSGFVAQSLAKIGLYPTGGHLVKRVIGVEGDIIECCDEQGRLKVNGVPLEESSYARPGECYGPMIASCSWTAGPVPAGSLFVMGDNRANSADSSRHLCTPEVTECSDSPWVDTDLVVGRLLAVVWPLGKARLDHRPETFESVSSAAEEEVTRR